MLLPQESLLVLMQLISNESFARRSGCLAKHHACRTVVHSFLSDSKEEEGDTMLNLSSNSMIMLAFKTITRQLTALPVTI